MKTLSAFPRAFSPAPADPEVPTSTSASKFNISIRALFRDTALQVALLAQNAVPDAIDELRKDCTLLVVAFQDALELNKIAPDVIHDAVYAQCGLLDETVLRHLPDKQKSVWDANPLQVERFQNHDAGTRIYERIVARMRETPPNLGLLECYSTILGLGFKGRYARDGESIRTDLMAALNTQIAQLSPMSDQSLIIENADRKGLIFLYRLSPWALPGVTVVAALLLYVLLGHSLDLQLSHLLQQKL
ncbi:DotU family type IV/VI secretion system protein [Glaciimonas sp. PAMC28666]|uniref:DotU family type IV/VI secretion system protein n=1 Tax=Glaciimonas sp. PAMC28666 TaxID=2807626 RepID=UPI0019655775|nr:DotU family type IV/VI secretion system protein [Glaciimonas sp. PAMC28666]QRX83118.1 DotU family type IV/VI secretion system protein [Glaciimonas sp. PAMC28666]